MVVIFKKNPDRLVHWSLFFYLLPLVGVFLFSVFDSVLLLWILGIVGLAVCVSQTNYANTRYYIYFYLLLITFTGNTNYMLLYIIADLFICICLLLYRIKVIRVRLTNIMTWGVLLLFGYIGGELYSLDRESFVSSTQLYFLLLVFIIISEFLATAWNPNNNYLVLFVGMLNIGLLSLFLFFNSMQDIISKPRALIMLLGDSGVRSNTLAGLLLPFFLILFHCRKDLPSVIDKTVINAILVLDLVLELILQSRGAFIALFVVFIITSINTIVIKKELNSKTLFKLIIGIILVSILLLMPVFQKYFDNSVFARFFITSDISNGRFQIYKQSIEMWRLHPFIGNGFGQFISFGIVANDPHNFVLGYLASCGLFGLLGFLLFIGNILMNCGNNTQLSFAIKTAIIVQIIHGLFEPVLTTGLPLTVFVCFCCILISLRPLNND